LKIPKINSINYGPQWIGFSFVIGIIVPVIIWGMFHVFLWWLVVTGAVSLFVFLIIFFVEMRQDFGKVPYYKKHLKDAIPFDPDTQYPVIKSSICTGEKVAGFKNRTDGKFVEVMLIKDDADKNMFMKIYGFDKVDTEY